MSYERTKGECSYCGQRFMTKEIARWHERACEENDEG